MFHSVHWVCCVVCMLVLIKFSVIFVGLHFSVFIYIIIIFLQNTQDEYSYIFNETVFFNDHFNYYELEVCHTVPPNYPILEYLFFYK